MVAQAFEILESMNPEERQLIVNKLQKQIRKNNWNYLCHHPEVRAFVRVILNEVVREKPGEVYDFTANLFSCNNMDNLTAQINEQIKRLNNLKDSEWTQYDGNMTFNVNSESDASMRAPTLNTILKFSGLLQDDDFRNYSEEKTESLNLPSFHLASYRN